METHGKQRQAECDRAQRNRGGVGLDDGGLMKEERTGRSQDERDQRRNRSREQPPGEVGSGQAGERNQQDAQPQARE
jgi:hypothetical protein